MTYQETIEYMYRATPAFEKVGAPAYKEGLETTIALDNHYGHPHRKYPIIHVAGTNGKGSTSHTIAAILQKAGLKVGLYTSPHLVDFSERIRVNGLCISKEYVVDFFEDYLQWKKLETIANPSFFEITTAMAFSYFADQQVDIAVIEVGLGGRLDCTNIVNPILSIITNISFDHTGLLGDTLEKIAAEKAGIIKKGVPVIIGETTRETREVFEKKAKECDAPIFFAETFDPSIDAPTLFGGKNLEAFGFELQGNYQKKNKQTILCAMSVLRSMNLISLNPKTDWLKCVKEGMEHVCSLTGLQGRWQTLQTNPLVICDTGHNVAGWKYLTRQIKSVDCQTLRIVFGMVDDKDIKTVISLLPKHAVYYWTQADTHRAISSERIQTLATEQGLYGKHYSSVSAAYQQALKDAGNRDFIFVGGSSYVVADLLTNIVF